MQTNDSSECKNQPDAAQVDGIVTLPSAEWYAMRFAEMQTWLQREQDEAEQREQKFDAADQILSARRNSGIASMACRARCWIDHFVNRSK